MKEEQTPVSSGMIIGRNPVMEALKNDRQVDKLIVGKDAEGSIKKILGMAKEKRIPVQFVEKSALDRMAKGGVHQSIIAMSTSYDYCEVEDLLTRAQEKGEQPFLVILDGIEDPHNLGAILRTADGAGAHGVIIPKRRAVGITDTVIKSAAGAVEYVPVARVPNLAQTIDRLKSLGVWIAGCDMDGDCYHRADLTGSLAIVIGAEGKGISRLVREKCDFVLSIPMAGKIESLNASNAAAVLLFEARKQREK